MELIVTKGIVEGFFKKFNNCLNLDTAIVGAGPSGLLAAYYLAKAGKKVAVFERKLAPGGGMWGGGMLFNEIVVQKEAISILDELQISYNEFEKDYFLTDAVEATAALIYYAKKAGAVIFNGISVEDVTFSNNEKVNGIVINWAPISREGLHVDPLMIMAKTVLDGTGHPCEVSRLVASKNRIKLDTPTGDVMGERSLNAEQGEEKTIENTKELFPGLFVSGMAANGVSGSFRMGPIFGGMLLSGKKVSKLIIEKLNNE